MVTVCGDNQNQTNDVKWLKIKNIQDKFNRPYTYDLGKTYKGDTIEFSFNFCTEHIGEIYLLHILIKSELTPNYSLAISVRSDLMINKKTQSAYLSPSLKTYAFFYDTNEDHIRYFITYQFNDHEVNTQLTDTDLYIPVSFTNILPESMTDILASHNYSNLLTDSFNSDFTIESGDGVKFNVHKCILSAHSAVFKAMFQQPDSVENQCGYVKLTDETADDLKYLLEYIYSGTVSDIYSVDSSSLLIISDKYMIKGLKDLVERVLLKQLSFDNAQDILELARICNAELAKSGAENFIKKYDL